jgi:hypothetical protein
MDKVLFIIQKDQTPKEGHTSLTIDGEKIKLYRDGAFEEFSLQEAQEKLKDVYNSVDYIVYENKPVREYLTGFQWLVETFQEYRNPEVGIIYSDYYKNGSGLRKHEFMKNFTPENFIQNIPPVIVVNKKYLQGLPMVIDQQLAMHLVSSCPILHIPESTYILG